MYFTDLPCGQEDDRWHQLLQSNSKTARGSLRLGALFKDLVILPIEEYGDLKEVGGSKSDVYACFTVGFVCLFVCLSVVDFE